MTVSDSIVLGLQGLSKRFDATTVVKDCSLDFRGGEIHALLGANGAGKSTLVRMIAGLLQPSGGSMELNRASYSPINKRAAERAGVEIVQQELNLISSLSVAENLLLNRLPTFAGIIHSQRLHEQARQALDRMELGHVRTDSLLRDLGVGQQQMIEIAAALHRECRVLILDEPTASLSAAESKILFGRLEKLREEGVAIIYISHRLDEVKRISNRITVLRDGHVEGTFDTESCSTERMVELMSGDSKATKSSPFESHVQGDPLLRVERLSGGPVQDVSLQVRRGERLGIAGLVGAGRTELLRLIYGADRATQGTVTLCHEQETGHRFRHPAEGVAAGLAMVTEDRKENGLLLSKSIRFNTSIASMWRLFSFFGIADSGKERLATDQHIESLEIRCEDAEQSVKTLSGGNQQKVAIAKWLVRDADVFLFDEPTRGIDVAARRRIYRLIDTLASQGKGMVIVSSDTEELLEICDRIAVMSAGRLVETFQRGDWSEERIMRAAFSGYRDRESVV